MTKYTVQKKLDNGSIMLVFQIYAASKAEATKRALVTYQWNKWLTEDQIIVKKA